MSLCAQAATVSGTTYRDINENGVFDNTGLTAEPGVGGATLTATDELGNSTSVTSNALSGAYSITLAGNRLRIEATTSVRIEPGASGFASIPGARTNVLFTTGNQTARDIGFSNPAQYCQDTPQVVANVYSNGNPHTPTGSAGTNSWMVRAPFVFPVATNPANVTIADGQIIGSTFGMAYQRSTDSLFASAFLKRHSGLGVGDNNPVVPINENTNETGAIYRILSPAGATPVASLWLDLQAQGIPTGSVSRVEVAATPDFEAPPTVATSPNIDADAFDKVGKVGLGAMSISEDERTLWVINLNDRKLYEIPITIAGGIPTPVTASIVSHDVAAAAPVCTNGLFRPFAVKAMDGFVYVGGVCTAESAGATAANLRGIVMRHDPSAAPGTFATVANFAINYARGDVSNSGAANTPADWRPWRATWGAIVAPAPGAATYNQVIQPQPILSDIEFDVDGSMVLSFMDRFSHQSGNNNYSSLAADGSPRAVYEAAAGGETVLACFNSVSGQYDLETAGGCGGRVSDATASGQGPGGGEFFWHDKYDSAYPPTNVVNSGAHREITLGGAAIHSVRREMASSVFDPRAAFRAAGWRVFNLIDLDATANNNAGEDARSVEIFGQDAGGGRPVRFGKAAGLGNVELICNPPPLELGNRVWRDTNHNGIQDPAEAPIANVAITLYSSTGVQLGQTTTNANGEWYFTFTQQAAVDPSNTDFDVRLANPYFQSYFVAIDATNFNSGQALFGYSTTLFNADPSSNGDARDSDGSSLAIPVIGARVAFNVAVGGPGANDHLIDFGFVPIDYGDLPDTGAGSGIGNYSTLLADNGASHIIVPNLQLGASVDAEVDGQPNAAASGDDINLVPDDEDGITVADLSLRVARAASVRANATNLTGAPAQLCGFIDFNGDGDFADAGETAPAISVPTGSNNVQFTLAFGTVPAGAASSTYARFRLSNDIVACASNGAASTGEVEDYPVGIVAIDLGDLPDTAAGTSAGNYNTLEADNGASHQIVSGLLMGATVDAETDGQPNVAANGDDTSGAPDDEDGVTVADLALIVGNLANIRVNATNTTGAAARLCGFVDFNGDGDFADAGENAPAINVPNGSNNVQFTLAFGAVPAGSATSTYARFRLASGAAPCSATGAVASGEVEDYPVGITPLDLGDLPDSGVGTGVGNYSTLIADNGPRHPIVPGLRIGANEDSEANGQPNIAATGDDLAGAPDDEDGVTVADLTLTAGAIANVRVNATDTIGAAGQLCGFIDFNGDGDFADAGETAPAVAVPNGSNNVQFTLAFGAVPLGAATSSYARFRLSTDVGACSPTGLATNGEVEDYAVTVVQLDLGDLPDTAAGTGIGNYSTLLADNGPRHPIVAGLRLGANEDAEANGQPNAAANGDDTTGAPDDEDGVTVADLNLVGGTAANVRVNATNLIGSAGQLCGFVDFNGDGDFADAGETAPAVLVPNGSNNVQFTVAFGIVPLTAASSSYARFRLSTDVGACTPTGAATNGEVEDYTVAIAQLDLGDLPDTGAGTGVGNYSTLLADNGPSHPIIAGLRLGANEDGEANGQPNVAATGDDLSGVPDDEDGVTVADLNLTAGANASVRVNATNTAGAVAQLCGFVDFNGDGDFADAGETAPALAVPNGSNNVQFTLAFGTVPLGAASSTYARFRLSTDVGACTPTGAASNGEVEDYAVTVGQLDLGDLPDTGAGSGIGNYSTLSSDNGPRHPIVAGLRLGANEDAEGDGQPNAAANGDDTTGTPDDEDGVTISDLNLVGGIAANVRVNATNTVGSAGQICGFVDFNGDGDFADAGETAPAVAVPNGSNNVQFTVAFGVVPLNAVSSTYARFRLSTDVGACSATGLATNGEVEDYTVAIAQLDLGDLPDTGAGTGAGNYSTLLADNGPSHPIVTGLRLGANEDGEANGQPTVAANGDDLAGTPDDEDGVTVADLNLIAGSTASVRVNATNTVGSAAQLCGFVDFNGDGDFADAGESAPAVVVANGSNNVQFSVAFGTVPLGAASSTYARFRLSTDAGACTPTGAATNGEVEDYAVAIGQLDLGDLPDTGAGTGIGNYSTLLADNGPRHPIVTGLRLGANEDGEANGQPNAAANGDDLAGAPDDEDGVTVADLNLTAGAIANVRVNATDTIGSAAQLCGFVDFNGDGDFADAGETAPAVAVPNGSNNVQFTVNFGTVPVGSASSTYARFRLSTDVGACAPNGLATDGEVEDYAVAIAQLDLGDLPDTGAGVGTGNYSTLLLDNGPRHPIVAGLRMGANEDAEADGQPGAAATGDDTNGVPDDEDGVTVADLNLVGGTAANVRVNATNTVGGAAQLCGFVDFNGDGDFVDAGETAPAVVVPNGSNSVQFTLAFGTVPLAAVSSTYARFRLSTDAGACSPTGAATDGEVEDYAVSVGQLDLGDLPDSGAGTGIGNYSTLLTDNGPRHPIVAGLRLGSNEDSEADGQPNAAATGDDLAGVPDDEDGVTIADLNLTGGAIANVRVNATNTIGVAAQLCGFVDFNGDGDFADVGESAAAVPVPNGSNNVQFTVGFGTVPLTAVSNTYARFRLSSDAGACTPTGAATDGEVEDYTVAIGQIDLGDLPDTGAGTGTGNYATLFADAGPRHPIVAGLRLGANEDGEADGQPNAAANGDDLAGGVDDEDGVTVADLSLTAGATANVRVNATNTVGSAAQLCGFVDFNGDGDFADAGETAPAVAVPNGSNNVQFTVAFGTVPLTAVSSSYARFRLSTDVGACTATGTATNGEVEDYAVSVGQLDLGDLPDSGVGTGIGNYSTLLSDNGPRHPIVAGLRIGANEDSEADGQPNAAATGDDLAGVPDDEDGVTIADLNLTAGTAASVRVNATNTFGSAAQLCGFVDFNGDGDFADAGESAPAVTVPNGSNNVQFSVAFGTVPATAVSSSYARFRLSTDAGACTPVGLATNGEVEDYAVAIARLDFGDLPDTGVGSGAGNYATLLSDNGPRHPIVPNLFIGATVDPEADGQPGATANGDDANGAPDDEDGVNTADLALQRGVAPAIRVTVTNGTGSPGLLCGYLDYNADGDFADAGEAAQIGVPNGAAGSVVTLNFGVVPNSSAASSYARFRLSTDPVCSPVGAASNGEVEDYPISSGAGILSLGNLVWNDRDNDGSVDPGEPGLSAVSVSLYRDSNDDGVPDGASIATTSTNASGNYLFQNLDPDTYIVEIAAPTGYSSSSGSGLPYIATGSSEPAPDPDNNVDNDDNGTLQAGVIRSAPVTLSVGTEPINDGDADPNSNLSVDFGLLGNFDLALRKVVSAGQTGPFLIGQDVSFDISVFNQGGIAADTILINDYIPAGFALSPLEASWTLVNPNLATRTIAGPLAPGANTTVSILLRIQAGAVSPLVNRAEIGAADDDGNPGNTPPTDIDSTPNGNPSDDAGGSPNTPSDDSIDGNGTGTPGDSNPLGDEDDADPATINVGVGGGTLGLAKSAQIITISGGGEYGGGGTPASAQIGYVVFIHNYSTQPISDLQIVENLVSAFGSANTWSVGNITAPTLTLNGAFDGRSVTNLLVGTDVLAPGTTTTIRFVVTVQFTPGTTYTNQVLGTGRIGTVPVSDLSHEGTDPAPGGGDPSDTNAPTRIRLGVQVVPMLSNGGVAWLLLGLLAIAWRQRRRMHAAP
ncbi:MAG: GEVED domain-containing protein [Tahibacter sp.]